MTAEDHATATVDEKEALLHTVRSERTERTTAMMREHGLDHLLLQTADNIRYVSDYRSLIIHETADHMLCVLDRNGDADIFGPHLVDPVKNPDPHRPKIRSVRPLTGWTPIMAEPATVVRALAGALTAAAARNVGYDALHPELLRALRAELPAVTFSYVGATLLRVRRQKSSGEITLMEGAYADNMAALNAAFAIAAPGVTDRELLAASLRQQQLLSSELITHSTCHVRADYGNWFPSGRVIKEGDAIFIDQCYYGTGGYASDLTRTVFIGEPRAEILRGYAALIDANRIVQDAAKPGIGVAALHDLLNESLRRNGLAPTPYGLGHGIGLRIMEPPSVSPGRMLDQEVLLVEGEVIAFEPETTIQVGGEDITLKVEDCFVVEKDGLRPLGPQAAVEGAILAH